MRNKYNMTAAKFSSIYQEYKESGLSIKEYCLIMSYNKSSFYDWLKKYPNIVEAYDSECSPNITSTPSVTISPLVIVDEADSPSQDITSSYPSCVPVSTSIKTKKRNNSRTPNSQKIEITHPSGLSIKLSGALDSLLLESILKHL